jgi:predicted O-methyltransferase YrrM
MDHFYEKNEGMFTYPNFYAKQVQDAVDGDIFVEIGSWKGRSAAYMAVEIMNSDKKIDFFCVDSFEGDKGLRDAGFHSDGQKEIFIENMKPAEGYYQIVQGDSAKSADNFKDGSLKFVFIDAEHTYEAVKRDITAWLPKVKPGGILSGHDYGHVGVTPAVHEVLGQDNIEIDMTEVIWVRHV